MIDFSEGADHLCEKGRMSRGRSRRTRSSLPCPWLDSSTGRSWDSSPQLSHSVNL